MTACDRTPFKSCHLYSSTVVCSLCVVAGLQLLLSFPAHINFSLLLNHFCQPHKFSLVQHENKNVDCVVDYNQKG